MTLNWSDVLETSTSCHIPFSNFTAVFICSLFQPLPCFSLSISVFVLKINGIQQVTVCLNFTFPTVQTYYDDIDDCLVFMGGSNEKFNGSF